MFYIWEAAVTDFYGVPVEDFAQFVVLGEVLVDQGEEDFGNIGGYIDVEGGLNHVTFRFLVLFSLQFLVGSVSNCRFGLYPLFFRASIYGGMASLNVLALLELVESRLLMPFGRFLMTDGGWLLCL